MQRSVGKTRSDSMPQASELRNYGRRLEEMKQCRTAAELLHAHGAPDHKVQHKDMEIWHYPLGTLDGFLYSIHAAVLEDQLAHVYLHLDPTADTVPAARRPCGKGLLLRI